MNHFILFLVVTLGIGLVISLAWRFSSRWKNRPCPSWLRWMVELDNPFAISNQSGFIVQHLDLMQGMKVLDAGCGPGRLTIPLSKAVGPDGAVIAADMQEGMLSAVKSKAVAQGISNITTVQTQLGANELEQNAFDRAVLAAVLGEIPDRYRAMKELFACLKPGGVLAIAELIFDPHFQRQSTVLELASKTGFKSKEIYGNGFAYLLLLEKPVQE